MEDALRLLLGEIENLGEAERIRVAQQLHDVLGQSLARLKMDLVWMRRHLARPALRTLDGAVRAVEGAIDAVHRIGTELRPTALDVLGLAAAAEADAESFGERTGIDCVVNTDPGLPRLEPRTETALFRILREALANVALHAGARRVEVRLTVSEGAVKLEVEDDGRGITDEEASRPTSLGLLGMREQLRQLGGTLAVRGEAGHGTRLSARVPARSP
jgi:signal transduction histidine kinase